MLKRICGGELANYQEPAAFGRLCVETVKIAKLNKQKNQPPSGGCVLKPYDYFCNIARLLPAAFGRLCVETAFIVSIRLFQLQPPSGGCVLKQPYITYK